MEAILRAAPGTDAEDALRQSAQLVRAGLTAFFEGNPFRGRRVQDASRQLLADLDAWQEGALALWPDDPEGFERRRALSDQAETLARVAQQLGGLAESRPATRVHAGLRDAARRLAAPLEGALAALGGVGAARPEEALEEVRRRKQGFMAWCAKVGRDDPRLFSSCLLAVAAAQRIEEAAQAVAAAAQAPLAV